MLKKKKKENLKKSYTMLNCQRDNLLKRNGPIYIFQKPSIKCLSISTKVRIDQKIKGKNNIYKKNSKHLDHDIAAKNKKISFKR
jgi:hypothetical protein